MQEQKEKTKQMQRFNNRNIGRIKLNSKQNFNRFNNKDLNELYEELNDSEKRKYDNNK